MDPKQGAKAEHAADAKADVETKSSLIPVTVMVGRAPPHTGVWEIGRHFANGSTDLEVTTEQLVALEHAQALKIYGLAVVKRAK